MSPARKVRTRSAPESQTRQRAAAQVNEESLESLLVGALTPWAERPGMRASTFAEHALEAITADLRTLASAIREGRHPLTSAEALHERARAALEYLKILAKRERG